ncbi:MAG: response regulator [Candidatus Rokubacteria bacterium]|nr:response regulator [Candidatus Rokubacteria bacterium]
MKLRSHLLVLVLATIVPFAGFAVWLVVQSHSQTRAATERGLLETARALMVAVDRELDASTAALGALATSEHLATGDLKSFDRVARAALPARGEWETIVLYEPDGRQLMNLHRPFGSPLPSAGNPGLVARVVETRAAAVSGLFLGRVTGRQVVQVGVPVRRQADVAYVLCAVLGSQAFEAVLQQERLPDEFVATLIDQDYRIVVRTRRAADFVGQKVTPDLQAAMAATGEGTISRVTKEGTAMYGAFSRSSRSGWTVSIGVPRSVVDAPLRRSLWLLIGLATLSVGAAAVLAGGAARHLTRSILSLVTTTTRLLKGEQVHVTSSSVAEVDQVATAMAAMASERRQTEEALRRSETRLQQAQKMEAVGRLAGGVAHDFNNLLTVLMSGCEVLSDDYAPDDPRRRTLGLIERSADRAAQLTRQLLAFSRRQVLQPKVMDLTPIVSGMAPMLQRLIGEDVELVLQLSPGLAAVRADPGQIEQVVMNLAANARDAMPRGGRLTIATENVEPAGVVLKVSDTGAGMDAKTQAQIFEPFFTTKPTGKGTGLGLATVHGIVEQHAGTIEVESIPGRGTTFTIAFPRAEEMPESVAAAPQGVTPPTGPETVLLVEDEAEIRALARAILTKRGYVVLEADDGVAALEQSERYDGPIHLLLTDVVMPRMSGPDLASRMKAARPRMKILYISGYATEKLDQHGLAGTGVALLEKPFTPTALAAKVRDVLGGAHGISGAAGDHGP